jgi:hypothetical protein
MLGVLWVQVEVVQGSLTFLSTLTLDTLNLANSFSTNGISLPQHTPWTLQTLTVDFLRVVSAWGMGVW